MPKYWRTVKSELNTAGSGPETTCASVSRISKRNTVSQAEATHHKREVGRSRTCALPSQPRQQRSAEALHRPAVSKPWRGIPRLVAGLPGAPDFYCGPLAQQPEQTQRTNPCWRCRVLSPYISARASSPANWSGRDRPASGDERSGPEPEGQLSGDPSKNGPELRHVEPPKSSPLEVQSIGSRNTRQRRKAPASWRPVNAAHLT